MPTAIKNSIIDISSEKKTKELATNFSNYLKGGELIFLYGEIGVGKTTFARFIINNFERKKKIKKSEVLSPTFNISFEYDLKKFVIKHFDLYRIKNEKDVRNIGLFEDSEKSIYLIEWPEIIKKKPKNRIEMLFKYSKDENERILKVKSFGRLKNYEF